MEQAFSVYRKIERSPKVAVHGQVHTKPHIVELMLDLVGYTGDPETKVLDPGCGDGAFTVASVRRLIASQGPPREHDAWSHCFLAIDQDEVAVENCRASVVKVLTEHGTNKKLASQLGQSWVIHGDFLERSFDQRFDLVIGNPPYVRQEAIAKDKLDFYRARYRCFYDRADLYVAFFERGLNLLQPDGQLAYICPDRFVKNQYGKKLRQMIAEQFAVNYVIDLAQASPFVPDVTCYPGIFVLREGAPSKHVDYFRLTEASEAECDAVRRKRSNGHVVHHRYDEWFKGEQQWSIESPEHLALLRKLESGGVALGDEASGCRVGIGVASGADNVFIVDANTKEVERSLLMPLVTTKDIAGGRVEWQRQCIINPFVGDTTELIDFKKFPKAAAYFGKYRDRLRGRNVAKRDQDRWYRTIDRIYPWLQKLPKLLIPDIKAENLIVLEPGELYPHHNLYYVASACWNLAALRSILRSSIGKFFVWMYGVKMRGDFLRFQAQYLRRICIPQLKSLSKRTISQLIEVSESEDQAEIDAIVARAYGLNDAEMSVIRSLATPRRMR